MSVSATTIRVLKNEIQSHRHHEKLCKDKADLKSFRGEPYSRYDQKWHGHVADVLEKDLEKLKNVSM